MKTLTLLSLFVFSITFSQAYASKTNRKTATIINHLTDKKPKAPKSPRKMAEGMIGDLSVKIDYGSPYVKERVVWGKLVKYNKVWRAGANETTAITFSKDVSFGGKNVKAGTYAFFIRPIEEGPWEIILNTEWSKEEHNAWGAYRRKEKNDVVQFSVKPSFDQPHQESLLYQITEKGMTFQWEKIRLSISITSV